MDIGIIDVDLLKQPDHNFPNLALMKLSGYYKTLGHNVKLITFDDINPKNLFCKKFDKVFISKVFTDSFVPKYVFNLSFVEYGGTGFFYDKAPNLPRKIEHSMPDYHLYDIWIKNEMRFHGRKKSYFKYYTDFAVGFVTRGCFRQCEFCVNRNEERVYVHSPLSEFVDDSRKKICLLDDNVLGCGEHWERIIRELQDTKKPFQFKQGLDIRLLNEKKAKILNESKYEGNYIFAFDHIEDTDLIMKKLTLWNKYTKKHNPCAVLYCFCCFDKNDKYDLKFWVQDVIDLLERVRLLMMQGARPYVMRYVKHKDSPFKKLYQAIMSWCNSGNMFQKQSLRDFCKTSNNTKLLNDFQKKYPDIASEYFDIKFTDYYVKTETVTKQTIKS
jgi:hypothetical protein